MVSKALGYGQRKLIDKIVRQTWDVDNPAQKKFTLNEILYIIQEMQDDEGKAYFEQDYEKGTKLQVFHQFVKHLLYRNIANYDSMVLVTSEKGTGKSSSSIMMAREWCRLLGIQFNPERHMAYSNQDVMDKIDQLSPFEPLIADEAVRFASSADWNKKESKALKKKLAEVRTKHLLFILCFPLKIKKVEKTYLEAFVNYWCDLFGRGLGVVYVKDKNPVNDPWRQKDFQKIGSYTEFTALSDVEKKLKKHPNFWKLIRFPKPPKHVYERYVKVRESNVYNNETVRQTVTSDDVQKALLVLALQDVMQNDSALTINRIALYIKNTYDIPITSNHIKNAISDAKQLVNKLREENAKDVTTS